MCGSEFGILQGKKQKQQQKRWIFFIWGDVFQFDANILIKFLIFKTEINCSVEKDPKCSWTKWRGKLMKALSLLSQISRVYMIS
jgi:hypothetical protein